MSIEILRAIQKINPDASYTLDGDNIDNIVWVNGTTPIPKADIEAKIRTELDIAMEDLRFKRNSKLAETDWVVLPDSPIADKTAWQNYRTELRDLTNGLTTVEEVDAVIWPTKPGA